MASRCGRGCPAKRHSQKGEKIEFTPSEAQRYKERSQAERSNARLKDDYGGRQVKYKISPSGETLPADVIVFSYFARDSSFNLYS